MTATSKALEKQASKPDAMIADYKDDFALVLPSHINANQWVRTVQGIVRRNPGLLTAAKKNPGSFMAAMLRCAHLGLEPGDTYHLVPFGQEVVGITDFKGEIELMYRAGEVISVIAEVVYENDDFVWAPGKVDTEVPPRWEGAMTRPYHDVDWFSERGEMVGAYAYAEMRSGAISRVVVMRRSEIERVKAVSKTAKKAGSPWQEWEDRMWLKTVCHQLKKWVPTSPEYRQEVLRQGARLEEVSPQLRDEIPAADGDSEWFEDDDPDHPFRDDDVVEAEIVEEGQFS